MTRTMTKSMIGLRALLVSLVFALPGAAWAHGPSCRALFSEAAIEVKLNHLSRVASVEARREGVRSFLREHPEIPAFSKSVNGGRLSVILVNEQTRKILTPLLERTAGFGFEQRPGYYADHGVMRVGKMMIDRDEPGRRSFGELHKNGIAWKSTDAYLPRRSEKSRTIVEIGYLMSEPELRVTELYQRLRRSGMIELPFEFDVKDKVQPPNTILPAVENCFGFCKAEKVPYMLDFLSERIVEISGQTPDAILSSKIGARFVRSVETHLMAADAMSEAALSRDLVEKNPLLPQLEASLGNPKRGVELAHWLVAFEVTRLFHAVLKQNRITDSAGLTDMDNERATFVMIYDNESRAPDFRDGSYESKGLSFDWTADNQSRLTPSTP